MLSAITNIYSTASVYHAYLTKDKIKTTKEFYVLTFENFKYKGKTWIRNFGNKKKYMSKNLY